MPSRSVTASKLPPDMLRTTMASGRQAPNPSIASPVALGVVKPHAVSVIGTEVTPSVASARDNPRACQSMLSITRPICGRHTAGFIAVASREGRIEEAKIQLAGVKAVSGFNRRYDDLG